MVCAMIRNFSKRSCLRAFFTYPLYIGLFIRYMLEGRKPPETIQQYYHIKPFNKDLSFLPEVYHLETRDVTCEKQKKVHIACLVRNRILFCFILIYNDGQLWVYPLQRKGIDVPDNWESLYKMKCVTNDNNLLNKLTDSSFRGI